MQVLPSLFWYFHISTTNTHVLVVMIYSNYEGDAGSNMLNVVADRSPTLKTTILKMPVNTSLRRMLICCRFLSPELIQMSYASAILGASISDT